jgi:hypothetical protein
MACVLGTMAFRLTEAAEGGQRPFIRFFDPADKLSRWDLSLLSRRHRAAVFDRLPVALKIAIRAALTAIGPTGEAG